MWLHRRSVPLNPHAPATAERCMCAFCGETGSAGYGFWYRLLNNPEGPSATTTSCPKFTPLAQFKNNVAHSNMFYGFRIHPEYYPIQRPCDMLNNFQQVPAVFDGLISYKNGVKGAIATQVGDMPAIHYIFMLIVSGFNAPALSVALRLQCAFSMSEPALLLWCAGRAGAVQVCCTTPDCVVVCALQSCTIC